MPIDIKKLRQFQEIDKQLVTNPAIEMVRKIAETQNIKEQYLKSMGIGVNWREEQLKYLGAIREDSFRDLLSPHLKQNITELMNGFAKNNFQDVLALQMQNIAENFKTSHSSSIGKALDAMRNSLGVVSAEELYNLRNLGVATNLSFIKEMGMVAKAQAELFRNDSFAQNIASLSFSHTNFLANTLKGLELANNNYIANALKGSITLANEQMLNSAVFVQPFLHDYAKTNTDYLPLIKPNRFRVQKQELLRRDDIEEDEDYENLVIKTPSAISFDLVVNCLRIVGICNETAQTTKGNLIFTITNSVWSNSLKLLQVVPTNKETFAEIVDYLYFLLIEGAGKDVLRFITYEDKNQHSYFSRIEPEVEIIWKIKHLRNKWLRHDIEHGKDKDIARDYRIRRETLEWFGMQRVPQSRDEFVFLYNNLMLKVEEFLKVLLDRVSKFSN